MTIAILCPTRARAKLFKRMVSSAKATAQNPENIKFYVSIRDEDREVYTPEILSGMSHKHLLPDGLPTVFKWNLLSDHAMDDGCKLFMLAADDIIFTTPCWDKALFDSYKGTPHVFSLQDSRDEHGTPHPIVTREYIETMGYFLPPIFLHWFIDSWTVEIARANNCFTHMRDYMLVHDKPWDKKISDDTHSFLHHAGWLNSDRKTNEKCQHFLELEKKRLGFLLGQKEAA